MKHPVVYESQMHSIFMGGNISTDCPIVLHLLQSAMRSEQLFALAQVSTRRQTELGALSQVCHPQKAGACAHPLKGRLVA